jgi:DNA-binding NarL/FixJ family response regulator/signal transduction histidine kinase
MSALPSRAGEAARPQTLDRAAVVAVPPVQLLTAGWLPPRRLAAATAGLGVLSLLATGVVAVNGPVGGNPTAPLAVAEAAVLLVLVGEVVRVAPVRYAVPAGVLAGAAAAAWVLRFADVTAPRTLLGCLCWALAAALAAAVGMYLRAGDARRVRAVLEARRSQRLELALDLHDFVAHDLSEVLALAQAGRVLNGRAADGAGEAFLAIERAALQALGTVDDTVRVLNHTAEVAGQPERPAARLVALGDLPGLVDRFSAAGQTRVQLDVDPALNGVLSRRATAVTCRIITEALTNVRRHAPYATHVHVTVQQRPGPAGSAVFVEVTDDGPRTAATPTGAARRRGGAWPARANRAGRGTGREHDRRPCGTERLAGPGRTTRPGTRRRTTTPGLTVRPIRVLIADDQEPIRTAFRIILDAQPDMTVIADATDGITAVALARRLRPDVVLADIRMPRLDGLEVTRQLAGPDAPVPVRVVVVTTFDLDEYVHTALRNGASGFLLKRSGPALLTEAVRAAVSGDTLISPQLTVRLLRHAVRFGDSAQPTDSRALTGRELQVVDLVAQGQTNAEIARELLLAAGTVKNHIADIQHKLGTRNRVGIAAWAWETGHTRR